ncbi:heterokaryon incompatibility protein-domain-containing protein [Cadophora sp. MPI-SDFR-AT-0126]|nr:heterokaryon incompatibility protein-domain-containing protein [Leotiomycetes sp. MPI-SDFR-AT-0126]
MDGISFNSLPRTFQDAIVVTRRLGLTYLWIDSLCIIQDSMEDWEKESKEMQNVYANAVINISADSAGDSSMGLGRTGNLNSTLMSSIPISRCGGFRVLNEEFPKLDRDFLSHSPSCLEDNWTRHELQTRAWVLQERILSRRILHFCHCELVWECDTHVTCECLPRRTDARQNKIRRPLSTVEREWDTISLWAKLAALYSAMNLSFERDRPNAIAGLATLVSKEWSLSYVHGL